MDTITRTNGNGQDYTLDLPELIILSKHLNQEYINRIAQDAGLKFEQGPWGNYHARPTYYEQIVTLMLISNFKTRYYNNGSTKNTLFLKFDHHVGFEVDSICFDCVTHNRIRTTTMSKDSRLSC